MNVSGFRLSLFASAALVAGVSTPGDASAQAQPAPDSTQAQPVPDVEQMPDIVVQARRRGELLQDVPAVVNAVTADQIARLNFRSFTEVQNVVPGLQLTNNANGIGGNAQLRGVNFDVNASGNNPTVEFYFNDAPITAGVILQQLYDVGQIEVLRGPQGTLRGRASPSGSITVTAHKPDLNRFGGYADFTANNIGTLNIQGGLNIPVLPGIVAIRLAGVVNEDDNDRVNTIDRSQDGRDPYSESTSYRASAVVVPTDFLRFEGLYQRINTYRRGFDQVESFDQVNPAAAASPVTIRAADRLGNNASPRFVNQRFDVYNGRAELSLAGQQLIYQFQHYSQNLRASTDNDYGNFFPTTTATYQNTRTLVHSQSHEIRLQNETRAFDALDYVVGYFNNTNDPGTMLNSPTVVRLPTALGGGIATVVQTPVEQSSHDHEASFFGNLTAHIGESSEISGGIRAIHFQLQDQLLISGNRVRSGNVDDHAVIYSASAKHYFTRNIMAYASTGTSYRAPINVVGDFNIAPSARENAFISLPAERSTSYELGVKTSFFDRRVNLNVSGFHQRFSNFVYRVPGDGVFYVNTVQSASGPTQQVGSFNFVAAVPVEVNGLEGELAADVSSRVNVSLTASYALGKIRNGTIPCTDLNGDGKPDNIAAAPSLAQLQAAVGANNVSACTTNQRSSFLPPFSATAQAEYHHPLTSGTEAYLRGLLSFRGKSQGDPNYLYDNVGSYALFNLFAGLRDPKGMWEINFFAKNLFDEDRVLTRTTPRSTSFQQLGFGGFGPGGVILTGPTGANLTSSYTGITTTAPREFGLNFRFRFGSR